MENITETITKATEVMNANNMEFVTIWKTGKSFGFNFESKPVGFSYREFGVKRHVIQVIENAK